MFCKSAVSIPINLNLQKEAYLHVKQEPKMDLKMFAKFDLFELVDKSIELTKPILKLSIALVLQIKAF